MSDFSAPGSYERAYLSFDPVHRLMQERNITDLQLAQKVGVKVDIIRNTYRYLDTVTLSMVRSICEALDSGPGDDDISTEAFYCPKCGRPLSEYAAKLLQKRIGSDLVVSEKSE